MGAVAAWTLDATAASGAAAASWDEARLLVLLCALLSVVLGVVLCVLDEATVGAGEAATVDAGEAVVAAAAGEACRAAWTAGEGVDAAMDEAGDAMLLAVDSAASFLAAGLASGDAAGLDSLLFASIVLCKRSFAWEGRVSSDHG